MRINKLDGLRGIFSLMVVFYHFQMKFLPAAVFNNFIVRQSDTFVDFFFVLSGFVISYNYYSLSNVSEFYTYFKKRFIRLYPLVFYTALCSFIFKVLVEVYFPNLREHENLTQLGIKFLDNLFMTDSTPILGVITGVNNPSWSISSEMISYLAFGLVTIGLKRGWVKNLFIALLILSSALFLYRTGDYFSTGEYGFLRGLVSFFLGYFVWVLNKRDYKIANLIEIVLIIILLAVLYINNSLENMLFGMLSYPLLYALVILILLKTDGALSRLLVSKPMQYLGKISFSIYMTHSLVITIIPNLFYNFMHVEKTVIVSYLVLMLSFFVVIGYAHFTHKYIELKLGGWLKRRYL